MTAVGRRLAAMEARLLRMEALGERVSEVAKLTDGEFRFDQPAPVAAFPKSSGATSSSSRATGADQSAACSVERPPERVP